MSDRPKRTERLHLRLTEEGRNAIDKVRGNWPATEYVRRAVALAIKQGLKGPNAGEDTL